MNKKMNVKALNFSSTLLIVLGFIPFLMIAIMINHFRINGLQADIQTLYKANVKLAARLSKLDKAKTASEQSPMRSRQEDSSSLQDNVCMDIASNDSTDSNADMDDLPECVSLADGNKCDVVYGVSGIFSLALICMVVCRMFLVKPDQGSIPERTDVSGAATGGREGLEKANGNPVRAKLAEGSCGHEET